MVFFVVTFFLGGKLNKDNIKPILRKYNASKFQRRKVRIIPAIFFQSITKPLLYDLRKKGFLTISVKTFGGNELLKLLEELANLCKNIDNKLTTGKEAGAVIKKAFDLKLGKDNNIRGYLFHFIVKILFDMEYEKVEMSKKIKYNILSKEADVYCEDTEYRYIIECKSWSNFQNQKKEIKKWIDDKYQFYIDWNNEKNKNEESKKLKIYFIISLRDIDIEAVNKQFKGYSEMTFHNRTFVEKIGKKT